MLVKAFKALPKEKLDNLVWHVEQETRILCSQSAGVWTNGAGGG